MTTQELVIREKLDEYFSGIFEKELIDEIIQVGFIDKFKSGDIMVDVGVKMTHIPLIL